MKPSIILLFCAFAICATATASLFDDIWDFFDTSDGDGWNIPTADGSSQYVLMSELDDLLKLPIPIDPKASIKYYLYTPLNPTKPQLYVDGDKGNLTLLGQSNFNFNLPTKMIIHGWRDDAQSAQCSLPRSAFLDTGDFNVICLDWSAVQSLNYPSTVLTVPTVGARVAKFVDKLNADYGMPFKTLSLIGHSLGAHVSGFAGKNVANGQIHEIIGLDPAFPMYRYDRPEQRLNSTDAFYVETIQTSGGRCGFLPPIGKSAFYPNGGQVQVGCNFDITGACSHVRAYIYYAEAIRYNNFISVRCQNYQSVLRGSCGSCRGRDVYMGSPTNYLSTSGVFYVPLHIESPYGMKDVCT